MLLSKSKKHTKPLSLQWGVQGAATYFRGDILASLRPLNAWELHQCDQPLNFHGFYLAYFGSMCFSRTSRICATSCLSDPVSIMSSTWWTFMMFVNVKTIESSVDSTETEGRSVLIDLEQGNEFALPSSRQGELLFIFFTDGVWKEHICQINNHIPSAWGCVYLFW